MREGPRDASRSVPGPLTHHASRITYHVSIRHPHAPAEVAALLELVHEGDGVVFHRDQAVALVVGDELVAARAVLAASPSGLDHRGGADERPVEPLAVLAEDG